MKKAIFIVFVALIFFISGMFYYLLFTESGLIRLSRETAARIDGLSFGSVQGRLAGPFTLTGVDFSSDDLTLNAGKIEIQWKPKKLFRFAVHITDISFDKVRVKLGNGKDPDSEFHQGPPIIQLPLDIIIKKAAVKNIEIYQANDIESVEIDEVKLGASFINRVLDVRFLKISTPYGGLSLQGSMEAENEYPVNVTLNWHIQPDGYPSVKGSGEITGSLTQLNINQRISEPFNAHLSVLASDVIKKLSWEATLGIDKLALRKLNAAWPDIEGSGIVKGEGALLFASMQGSVNVSEKKIGALQGTFDIDYENEILNLKEILVKREGSDEMAAVTGKFIAGENAFNIKARWESLRWPVDSGEPFVTSNKGEIKARGSIDKYNFTIETDVSGNNIPASILSLEGEGTTKDITINTLHGKLLDGQLNGTASIVWSPIMSWRVNARAESLNPGTKWSDWSGAVNGTIDASGKLDGRALLLNPSKLIADGILRDRPLQAAMELSMSDGMYHIPVFELSSGQSRIHASGKRHERWDINWNMSIADLGDFIPNGKGAISGKGRISGAKVIPSIQGNIKGTAMAFDSYHVQDLSAVINLDLHENHKSLIDVEANEVSLAGKKITSFKLTGEGDKATHKMSVYALSDSQRLDVQINGGYRKKTWEGLLSSLQYSDKDFGTWKLQNPATLIFTGRSLKTGDVCFNKNMENLCLGIAWNQEGRSSATFSLKNLSLAYLKNIMPPDVSLQGVISGQGELLKEDRKLEGKVYMSVPSGSVTYAHDQDEQINIPYEKLILEAGLDESSLGIQISSLFTNRGNFYGKVNLPQFSPFRIRLDEQTIDGTVNAHFSSLDLLPVFTSRVENAKGSIKADFTLKGTVASPFLIGELRLDNGSASIPELGIQMRDISVRLLGNEDGGTTFNAHLSSGEGEIKVNGKLRLSSDKQFSSMIYISGEKFEVVKVPELHLTVSPDITLKIEKSNIIITGDLTVPEAKIEPRDFSSAIKSSKDVTVIGGGRNRIENGNWQINSNVTLILGDEVKFNGFGLGARITGKIHVIEEPQKPTKGQGELMIMDGVYKAYGQELAIDKGRLMFAGIVDDPGLNIRAFREVKEVKAGVNVTGTLKSPKLQVYSVPSMDESEALSYLMFGRSMQKLSGEEGNQLYDTALSAGLSAGGFAAKKIGAAFGIEDVDIESGETPEQAALFIGKYLSPRLYMSYGIGLFEPVSTIRVRYDLRRRLQVQTEYGIESAGDILYIIERE